MVRSFAPLALMLALLAAGCGDSGTDAEEGVVLDGNYVAVKATSGTDGRDLLAEGAVVAMRFVYGFRPIYRLVILWPPTQLNEGFVLQGYYATTPSDELLLFSAAGELIDGSALRFSGKDLLLEFQGESGLAEVRLTPATTPEPETFAGAFDASSFALQAQSGERVELVGAGTPVSLSFSGDSLSYTLSGTVPAGVLAEGEVELDSRGGYDTVGPVVVLGGALGCDIFAASFSLGSALTFQGVACSVAGEERLVEAKFDRR